jgi:hypothetical protein
MAACDDDNRLFRDFIVPNYFKIDLISKLTISIEGLQYEIQISKLTTTVETLKREVR